MHRANFRAAACLDAVRLAGDPARLQAAPADALLTAAAGLAKSLELVLDNGAFYATRAPDLSKGRGEGFEFFRALPETACDLIRGFFSLERIPDAPRPEAS